MLFQPKFQKSSNYQQQHPYLAFTMHRLFQDPSNRAKMVNFDKEEITWNFTPKVISTYSCEPQPNNNALIYTNAERAYSSTCSSSSSIYDSLGNSGSKIISSDSLNVENDLLLEQEKGKTTSGKSV